MKKILTVIAVMFSLIVSAQNKHVEVPFGIYIVIFDYDAKGKSTAKGLPATITIYIKGSARGMIGREVKGFYKTSFTDVELLKFVEKANTDHKEKRRTIQ